MNASCQTAAGVGWLGGQARPGRAKPREREREWRNIKYKSGNPFLSFSASLWSHRSIFYERPPLKWDQTVRVVRLDRCLLWPAVAPQRSYQLWKCEREKQETEQCSKNTSRNNSGERKRQNKKKKKERKQKNNNNKTNGLNGAISFFSAPACMYSSQPYLSV
jgi:hypothetical protein